MVPPQKGRETRLDFRLRDLLAFLTLKDGVNSETVYQLRCGWDGESPSAEINKGPFQGAGLKMQLSLELLMEWVQHAKRSEIVE